MPAEDIWPKVPGVVTRSGKVVVSIRTRKFGSSWSRTGAGPGSEAVGTREGSYSCSRAQMCWRRSATERQHCSGVMGSVCYLKRDNTWLV